jgi:membrane-associated phospholipid phosphatase
VPRLRSSEWLVIGYFVYVAVLAGFHFPPAKAWVFAVVVAAVVIVLAWSNSVLRDIFPMAFTLAAYREMDWFTPASRDHHLERVWIGWDRRLLDSLHLRAAIESTGPVLPALLEASYMLVYAVAAVSVAIVFLNHRRGVINRFWVAYLAGTLGAYALFPFFLSEPPRIIFPGFDLPRVVTVFRTFNLWILGGYAIHSSVFPSAHVSSTFSAAWGLAAAIPDRPRFAIGMATYGVMVAIATVYGRYHYAADAAAGMGVSLLAIVALAVNRRLE